MIWLDNSRILATFAVVLLHVSAGFVLENDIGTEYWWIGNIYDSMTRWCVPVFIMISGALLLGSNNQEKLTTFYRKRLSRILIPIVAWSAFFMIWIFARDVVPDNDLSLIEFLNKLLFGIIFYSHMWFLYMILGLYLFTPFFRKIIMHSSNNELLLFIAVTFIISAINYRYKTFGSDGIKLFINWFLLYVPFFFLGYFIRQDNHYPSRLLLWGIFLISFILTFIGCYVVAKNIDLDSGLYFYGYLSVTIIPMSISLIYILKAWNKPIFNLLFTKRLSILTLGIYLIHPVIFSVIPYKQYCAINLHPIISIPVTAFVGFIISTSIVLIIYKIPYLKRTI